MRTDRPRLVRSFQYIWNETLQCRLGRLFVVGFGRCPLWLFRWGGIDLRPRALTGWLRALRRFLLSVDMGIVLVIPHEHYDHRREHKTYSGNDKTYSGNEKNHLYECTTTIASTKRNRCDPSGRQRDCQRACVLRTIPESCSHRGSGRWHLQHKQPIRHPLLKTSKHCRLVGLAGGGPKKYLG